MNRDKIGNEYPALSTLSTICKVFGIVIVIFAVIGLFYGFSLLGKGTAGVIVIFSSLISGLLFSVPFFAFAELIKVFVSIELNTRKDSTYDVGEINNVDNSEKKFSINSHVVELKTEKQYRVVDTEKNLYICSPSGGLSRVSFREDEIELFSIWVEKQKNR